MTSDRTLTGHLAAFADQIRSDGIPEPVSSSIAQRVLDILGIQIAATRLETSEAILSFVRDQGGRGEALAVGVQDALPASWAAFAGGVLAHSLDFDDTHLPSVLHPSASVIPAAMAVAQSTGAGGRDLAIAAAAGIETCIRLGMAGFDHSTRNSVFFEHGQHATSICGTLGSAVAAAMLLDLPESGIADSIGIAASMASGILEGNRTGGTVKRIHCGWAAHSGVVAANLAAVGVTGPPTALEGRFGFFEAFLHGQSTPAVVVEELGERWEVPGIFFKPYPANHFTHAAADAAMAIRREGVQPETIESVTVRVATPTVRTIGEPIERKRRPRSGYEAQFSGPYVVAAALLGGSGLGLGLDDFRDALVTEPRRLALMDRIVIVGDDECDDVYPYQFPARVEVTLRDGSRVSRAVMENRGGPGWPLSTGELADKFADNVTGLLDETTAESVTGWCMGLLQERDADRPIDMINSDLREHQ